MDKKVEIEDIAALYNQWVDENPKERSITFIANDGVRAITGLRGEQRAILLGLLGALYSDKDFRKFLQDAMDAYAKASAEGTTDTPETPNQE